MMIVAKILTFSVCLSLLILVIAWSCTLSRKGIGASALSVALLGVFLLMFLLPRAVVPYPNHLAELWSPFTELAFRVLFLASAALAWISAVLSRSSRSEVTMIVGVTLSSVAIFLSGLFLGATSLL